MIVDVPDAAFSPDGPGSSAHAFVCKIATAGPNVSEKQPESTLSPAFLNRRVEPEHSYPSVHATHGRYNLSLCPGIMPSSKIQSLKID